MSFPFLQLILLEPLSKEFFFYHFFLQLFIIGKIQLTQLVFFPLSERELPILLKKIIHSLGNEAVANLH